MTDNRLTLKITGLGHKITLDMAETARIGDVKSEIENRTSLPVSYQRLISRGKKLDDNDATLTELQIKNRTSLMLIHNENYAADEETLEELLKLRYEIDELAQKANSISPNVVHELVTQLCCQLDSVDTHGSEPLRAMRKEALKMAEAIAANMDTE